MKFRFSIGFNFLIFLSWFILFTGASNENETITSLMDLNTNVLGLIINELLTIQDILTLRTTCQFFENLLRPNDKGMLDFCNYAESKRIINVNLFWINLEYFLNESYDNAFHETKIFSFCQNQYTILTRARDQKIISWFNNNDINYVNSEPLVKVYTKYHQAWVEFIKGGSVKNTGGENKYNGLEIPDDLAPKMKKIKKIVSTTLAFAVLLENGDVFAWGKSEYGGLIPDEIQIKLKNIKMIHSNKSAFVALSEDGKAYSWGCPSFAGAILSELENVKMIFSTDLAFAALLNDGNVRTWGIYAGERIFSEVQAKLKNVKMIFSDSFSFVALLQDGNCVSWPGDSSINPPLKKNVLEFYKNGTTLQ